MSRLGRGRYSRRNPFSDIEPIPDIDAPMTGIIRGDVQSNAGPQLPPKPVPKTPEAHAQKPRNIRTSQFFFLTMAVPFTGSSGENVLAATLVEQFTMKIRGAWSDLSQARVRLIGDTSGQPLSTFQVPMRSFVANSNLFDPLLVWRQPYWLSGGSGMSGEFINDGAEAAGTVVFFTERPDTDQIVPVKQSQVFILLLNLGLSGGATTTGFATTQQISHDLLVWGALSTSLSSQIQITDSTRNVAWSRSKIPVGAFAGLSNPAASPTNPEAIMYYPTAYLLPKQSSLRAEWINTGSESGKYIAFLCERILA